MKNKLFISIVGILLILIVIKENEVLAKQNDVEVIIDNVPFYMNINGKLVKKLDVKKGATFKVEDKIGNWYQIQIGEEKGFIYYKNLRIINKNLRGTFSTNSSFYGKVQTLGETNIYDNSNGSLKHFATALPFQKFNVKGMAGNWYQIEIGKRIVYIYKDNVQELFTRDTELYEVSKDSTAAYIKKGSNLIYVGELKKGYTFNRLGVHGNWHKIYFAGQIAYVYSPNTKPVLTKNNLKSDSNLNEQYYVVKNVNVYNKSNNKMTKMATIRKGTTLKIIKNLGNWLEISISGRKGYIYHSNVMKKDKYFSFLMKNTNRDQIAIVEVNSSNSYKAQVSFYERINEKWEKVISSPAVIGQSGITTSKKEGDKKSPVGLFEIGHGFGYAKPSGLSVPFKVASNNDYWIDDVSSSDYNKWVEYNGNPDQKWNSYERMNNSLYKYGLVIKYNMNPIVKGKGSAIFFHTWRNQNSPTLGCVALPEEMMLSLLRKVEPSKEPAVIIGTLKDINTY